MIWDSYSTLQFTYRSTNHYILWICHQNHKSLDCVASSSWSDCNELFYCYTHGSCRHGSDTLLFPRSPFLNSFS